jgi:hypothetical protein
MKTLADLSAPADIARKYLEKDVQKQCVGWARARGYWARKFSAQSQRSVPDYLFAKAQGPTICTLDDSHTHHYKMKFACEFKKPGTKRNKNGVMSTDAQVEEQEMMRLAGWFVFECDNFDEFKETVFAYEKEV